jgi:hypothetical protein
MHVCRFEWWIYRVLLEPVFLVRSGVTDFAVLFERAGQMDGVGDRDDVR